MQHNAVVSEGRRVLAGWFKAMCESMGCNWKVGYYDQETIERLAEEHNASTADGWAWPGYPTIQQEGLAVSQIRIGRAKA